MSSNKFEVDVDLLKKYDKPGPRYTSYPTAPHFHSGFGPNEYVKEVQRSNSQENPADISLYFHFPFCDSLCYYCACNTIITKSPSKIKSYLGNLKKEIQMLSDLTNTDRKVVQLHWGGGTPTYMQPDQFEDISLFIKDRFNFANDAEISIEIDPRCLKPEQLPALRRAGFNRVSFGVQDFNLKVQEAVNRVQPEILSRDVIQESRELGFDSINIDLIYGLPYQTIGSYKETLDKVIDISPDRIAVFNFAHVPWLKKHQELISADTLPKPQEKLQIMKTVIEHLTEAGYVFIGMDHFAKPDNELSAALRNHTLNRNFQGYTVLGGAEVFALGVTSISQLHYAYAQNSKTPDEYGAMLDDGQFPIKIGFGLDEDDRLRRDVINEIMCNNRIIKSKFEEKYNIEFDEYFSKSIEKLNEYLRDELIQITPEKIQVSEPGRLIVRNIAMAFDKYLEMDNKKTQQIYSRTV